MPAVAVWALCAGRGGLGDSTAVAIVIGAVLSISMSDAGSAYWANSESSRDVLFSVVHMKLPEVAARMSPLGYSWTAPPGGKTRRARPRV